MIFGLGTIHGGTSSLAQYLCEAGCAVGHEEDGDDGIVSYRLIRHVDRLAEEYPDAKFIHLCRDGHDVVRSNLTRFDLDTGLWEGGIFPFMATAMVGGGTPRQWFEQVEAWKAYGDVGQLAWVWSWVHRTAMEFGERHPDRYRRINLEDLQREGGDLLDWLGVDARPEVPWANASPRDKLEFTPDQEADFWHRAGETMDTLGYVDNPCFACGACCQSSFPPGAPYSAWFNGLPVELRDEFVAAIEGRRQNEPCLWWDGKCTHYDKRPPVCRDFEPGCDECNRIRENAGMEPIHSTRLTVLCSCGQG